MHIFCEESILLLSQSMLSHRSMRKTALGERATLSTNFLKYRTDFPDLRTIPDTLAECYSFTCESSNSPKQYANKMREIMVSDATLKYEIGFSDTVPRLRHMGWQVVGSIY